MTIKYGLAENEKLEIYSHRNFLARHAYFNAMLQGSFKEGKEQNVVINLSELGITHSNVENILNILREYFYSDAFPSLHSHDCCCGSCSRSRPTSFERSFESCETGNRQDAFFYSKDEISLSKCHIYLDLLQRHYKDVQPVSSTMADIFVQDFKQNLNKGMNDKISDYINIAFLHDIHELKVLTVDWLLKNASLSEMLGVRWMKNWFQQLIQKMFLKRIKIHEYSHVGLKAAIQSQYNELLSTKQKLIERLPILRSDLGTYHTGGMTYEEILCFKLLQSPQELSLDELDTLLSGALPGKYDPLSAEFTGSLDTLYEIIELGLGLKGEKFYQLFAQQYLQKWNPSRKIKITNT